MGSEERQQEGDRRTHLVGDDRAVVDEVLERTERGPGRMVGLGRLVVVNQRDAVADTVLEEARSLLGVIGLHEHPTLTGGLEQRTIKPIERCRGLARRDLQGWSNL